jgi:hypothetical protein
MKAEAVLIHLFNRPLARMALSPDQCPIIRSWLFIGPSLQPNGLVPSGSLAAFI